MAGEDLPPGLLGVLPRMGEPGWYPGIEEDARRSTLSTLAPPPQDPRAAGVAPFSGLAPYPDYAEASTAAPLRATTWEGMTGQTRDVLRGTPGTSGYEPSRVTEVLVGSMGGASGGLAGSTRIVRGGRGGGRGGGEPPISAPPPADLNPPAVARPAAPTVPPAAPAITGVADPGAEVLRTLRADLAIPKAQRPLREPGELPFDPRAGQTEMLPGVPQGELTPMRRGEGPPTVGGGRGEMLTELRDPIIQRMAADLAPLVGTDSQFFYRMRPVYEALRASGSSHEEAIQFIRHNFAPTNAGTSPRTPTDKNLRNTALFQYRAAQGLPNTEGAIRQATGAGSGYNIIYGTHPRMVEGLITGTHNVGQNPKPYYFGGNIGGDLAYTTGDTHAIRAVVGNANEVRPGGVHEGWLRPEAVPGYRSNSAQFNWATGVDDSLPHQQVRGQQFQPEYPLIHDIYEGVGRELNVPTADAQSLAWFNYGGRTGLESPPSTIPQLIAERVSATAQVLGITPQQAFLLYRQGRIPLLSAGGAAATLPVPGMLNQPQEAQ